MKHLILSFFSACLVTFYCSGQEIPEGDVAPAKRPSDSKPTARPISTIAVTFLSNDTCNLIINTKNYGEIVKSKTVNLPLGNYKLFFESLETGETIKKRSFRLTKDSLTGGRYTFPINFKHQH